MSCRHIITSLFALGLILGAMGCDRIVLHSMRGSHDVWAVRFDNPRLSNLAPKYKNCQVEFKTGPQCKMSLKGNPSNCKMSARGATLTCSGRRTFKAARSYTNSLYTSLDNEHFKVSAYDKSKRWSVNTRQKTFRALIPNGRQKVMATFRLVKVIEHESELCSKWSLPKSLVSPCRP